jgi:hypothetical protein
MRAIHALFALPMLLAAPAMAQDRAVQLMNESGFTIVEFYASAQGAADWEENMIAGQAVATGETVTVNFAESGDCAYTFRALFDDGDETIVDVDVCSVDAVTIN